MYHLTKAPNEEKRENYWKEQKESQKAKQKKLYNTTKVHVIIRAMLNYYIYHNLNTKSIYNFALILSTKPTSTCL